MTAQTADALIDAFKENEVLRIAIVDDGYDMPEVTALSEQDWLAITTAVDEADGNWGPHAEVLKHLGELPTHGGLRDEHVHALWKHHASLNVRPKENEARTDEIGDTLAKAFGAFAGRKMQKLQQLRHVEEIAERATGEPPTTFHSGVTAAQLQDFDLVFLDFFLGDEVDQHGKISLDMQRAAESRAHALVKDVNDLVRPKPAPLFVVISSLATNDNVPDFRDKAKLLGSKFRFLSKRDIASDPARRDFVLRNIVRQKAAGDAIELLTHEWQSSITTALDQMMESIRRLDVADYAYIKDYRLTEEKVSLLNYLTWLYNSYLGSFVEERLASSHSAALEPLTSLVSKSAILRPMSEVPRIYSRITTTKVTEFPDGEAAKVSTGDIFVRKSRLAKYVEPPKVQDAAPSDAQPNPNDVALVAVEDAQGASAPAAAQKEEVGSIPPPDVIAAVTPICDLVPGRIKAKNVVLVGGALTELSKAKEASNHLLVYERTGGQKPVEFQIKWDTKTPVSFPIGSFDGKGIDGTDYIHMTRLRELYSAEIAQSLAADLARVGVPIAPPFTRALEVEVRALKVKDPILSSMGSPGHALAWDLNKKKTGPARQVVFSEEFLWKLVDAVREKCGADSECAALVSDVENIEALLNPFDSTAKNPTKAGDKITVRTFTAGAESQPASGKELLVISLFAPNDA
ncbi:hypothetical protein [Paracoccus thiocyanatus]|uniref:Uncharacterized protein n=1 Tax=Paracoccus thiocyanatus TaxID=34006 RepID=A0A3D8PDR8_9RHOB|nr:hypothetical protein [Paracoccus thiocyanatus]RDW13607.1 hypothetical protein DIE28_07065 [Paracoccus thiocyanatus]